MDVTNKQARNNKRGSRALLIGGREAERIVAL